MADVRSVSNIQSTTPDEYVEQMRQKIGTGFSDQKVAGKKRNELGKDDFIKLMSAQLQHQDPMSPMKNEEMAAQLAQFSSLEQMVNVNNNLEKMTAAQKPQENVLAASLIGKKIMTDSSRFQFQKGAQPEMKFELPTDAERLTVSVVDSKGEVVREIELANMSQGAQSIRWDGKNGKNQEVTPGEYSYRISGNAPGGAPMQIDTTTSGLVSGVSFEGGRALLLVGDRKIPMEAVGRIEQDPAGGKAPAVPAAPVNPLAPVTKQNSVSDAQEKTTQPAKNNLPPGLTPEKIKSMIGALGNSSRMEAEPAASGAEEENMPQPLWNPARM